MKTKSVKKTVQPDIRLTFIEWVKYIHEQTQKTNEFKTEGATNG